MYGNVYLDFLLNFFIQLFVFLMLSCLRGLCIFEIYKISCQDFFFLRYTKYLVGCFICKYFLPFSELSYFVYGFLYVQKLLSLIRSHLFIFVYLFVCFHYFWCWIQKDMAAIYIKECFCLFLCVCVCM